MLPKLEITSSVAWITSGRYWEVPEVPEPTPTPSTCSRPVSAPAPAPYADSPEFIAGTRMVTMSVGVRTSGMFVTRSLPTTWVWLALWTSTVGASPVTVIVSSRLPICISAFRVVVVAPDRVTPSRLTVLNPGIVKVIE